MLRFGWSVRDWFSRLEARRSRSHQRDHAARHSAELEQLESRALLTGGPGAIHGVAFIDADGDEIQDDGELPVQGVPVTLTRTTPAEPAVTLNTTTDADGAYGFRNLAPGTYEITAGPGENLVGEEVVISDIEIGEDDVEQHDVALGTIASAFLSLRQFRTNTTIDDFPFEEEGADSNQAPALRAALDDVIVDVNSDDTLIDLAGVFNDADLANSQIRFKTNQGDINVTLFDAAAPQTVANFYNYIESDRYDNMVFQRLAFDADDDPFVLQGGGYRYDEDVSQINEIDSDPPVENEFSATRSNVTGTIAMAKTSDPNSATNEFFFNLGDNLFLNNTSNSGGFTVFGRVTADADQDVLDDITDIPTENHGAADGSAGTPPAPFSEVPLVDYEGTNFRTQISANPLSFTTDATADNFVLVEDVEIIARPESLAYEVISNSNEDLVEATIVDNRLTLSYAEDLSGTANIVVRATDQFGTTFDATFHVIVTGVELTSDSDPPTPVSQLTASVTADTSGGTALTYDYLWKIDGATIREANDLTTAIDQIDLNEHEEAVPGAEVTVEVTVSDGFTAMASITLVDDDET